MTTRLPKLIAFDLEYVSLSFFTARITKLNTDMVNLKLAQLHALGFVDRHACYSYVTSESLLREVGLFASLE